MARGKLTPLLIDQVYQELCKKIRFKHSKHMEKKDNITHEYVYSIETFRTYVRHCNYFVKWCFSNENIKKDLGHKPRTLEECKPYVEDFIRYQENRDLSAYTINLEKSALQKLYGEKFEIKTKSISRAEITRSRGNAKRDKHFSEKNNWEMVNACKHVGFRRSELKKCKAEDLVLKDGQYYVSIIGKGGKHRLAPILDNDKATIEYIKTLSGNNEVHSGADIHYYRSLYASYMYCRYRTNDMDSLKGKKINYTELTGKRDKNNKIIYKSALYICRKDQAKIMFDREAMIKASQCLGHNRENIIAEHYLHNLAEVENLN